MHIEADLNEAVVALHIAMPFVLNILARQSPQLRQELEETLAYAIECYKSGASTADTLGVIKILATWKENLAPQESPRLN
jgi:hypothetical protein